MKASEVHEITAKAQNPETSYEFVMNEILRNAYNGVNLIVSRSNHWTYEHFEASMEQLKADGFKVEAKGDKALKIIRVEW